MARIFTWIRDHSSPDSKFSFVMLIRSRTAGKVCKGTTVRALAYSSASFLWSRVIRTHRLALVGVATNVNTFAKVHTSLVPGQLFRHCLRLRTNLHDEKRFLLSSMVL
jgi:hypothetical protein